MQIHSLSNPNQINLDPRGKSLPPWGNGLAWLLVGWNKGRFTLFSCHCSLRADSLLNQIQNNNTEIFSCKSLGSVKLNQMTVIQIKVTQMPENQHLSYLDLDFIVIWIFKGHPNVSFWPLNWYLDWFTIVIRIKFLTRSFISCSGSLPAGEISHKW